MKRTTQLARAVGLLMMFGLAACAAGDPATEAVSEPVTDEPSTIEVVAVDFAFEGLPASVESGTQLTLRNDADSELHELVAFRLPDDEERSIADLMQLPPEEMMAVLGGEPATVLLTPAGGEQISAVGDGTLNEPGRYAIICMIPTGIEADVYLEAAGTSDGPPDVGGGPPHIVHGMFAELEVR